MATANIANTSPLSWLTDKHLTVILLALPVLLMTLAILANNRGMFIYTLDDPYIHLALAKQMFSGHYGINPGEFSAPSSSIIWPFLLAPFATLGSGMVLAPFFLNLIFAFLTIGPLLKLLEGLHPISKVLILGGFFLATNLYGLIFAGMEHTLQVYLVTLIACAVVKKEFAQLPTTPLPIYVALTLLPLVRYEGLAVSLPVLAYLFWLGEKRATVISAVLIGALVVSFSLFLNHLGLGYIPSSVMAKTGSGLNALFFNVTNQLDAYGWVLLAQLFVCVLFFDRKPLILMLLTVAALHTLFGRAGQGRYEAYWLTFVGVFVLYACVTRMHERYMTALFAMLPIAFAVPVYTTLRVPLSSAAIYNQQYSSGEIVRELGEPVAVNDLGLVALNGNQYILDLWGLGSIQALHYRKTRDDVAWMTTLMDEKNVHYAFVYNEWFPERPGNWIEVAEMRLTIPRASAAQSSVYYYATDAQSANKLRAVMERFRDETPNGKFTLNFPAISAAH